MGVLMKMHDIFGKIVRRINAFVKYVINYKKYLQLAALYNFNEYKGIYHVHIRKTGGTSLNQMFLALSGDEPALLYDEINQTADFRVVRKGLIYVGWNKRYINQGDYFYAFSHLPFHQLSFKKEIFTFCCFRDPVKRVISLYNMLMDYQVNEIDHPGMKRDGKWLGQDFSDFLKRIPREELLNQLYMFSPSFQLSEAVTNVGSLSYFFFNDSFNEGVEELNQKLDLKLQPLHARKASYKSEITAQQKLELRQMLEPEYQFLDALKKL